MVLWFCVGGLGNASGHQFGYPACHNGDRIGNHNLAWEGRVRVRGYRWQRRTTVGGWVSLWVIHTVGIVVLWVSVGVYTHNVGVQQVRWAIGDGPGALRTPNEYVQIFSHPQLCCSSNIPYFMFLRFREKAKVSSLKIQCYARVGRIQSTIDLSLDGDGHWIELWAGVEYNPIQYSPLYNTNYTTQDQILQQNKKLSHTEQCNKIQFDLVLNTMRDLFANSRLNPYHQYISRSFAS